jgi:RNA polymerase sigma-70 factor, ECF subfamily
MDVSDAAAVALARAGDGDAFRVLVDRHGRKLFRLAFRLAGNEEDAEDIVQETFLRAYRNLDKFDERALFTSWLFRIASNYSLDLLRMRKMRTAQSLSSDDAEGHPMTEKIASEDPNPERLMFSGQMRERIAGAMDELTPQERVAFTLRHFEGCTIEEISETLKISANATKHAVFRAVQKMRKALHPMEGEKAWRT